MSKKAIKPRGSWNGIRPVTRVTPTKQERIRRPEKKHRGNRNYSVG
jgi:hypothetical protein